MNEVPAGLDRPSPGEQLERSEEALTIITRLLDGETVDFSGRFRARNAVLYWRPERRPPVYLSAFKRARPSSPAASPTASGRSPTRSRPRR
jgi:coenzyme F420-dependent glucose-6-phosphate dehydrogenase